ncbi:MAG: nucleotidyltransferase family protein [Gemmataceae bacterium]
MTRVGGIVLCGGRSSRMGRPKAWLPVGDEVMLQRVVRTLGEVVSPVVVVAGPGQDVPPLPSDVRIVRDEVEGRGPLAGLAGGLAALDGLADAAYLSACDVPLLVPGFVRRVVELLEKPNPPAPFPEREGGDDTLPPGRDDAICRK